MTRLLLIALLCTSCYRVVRGDGITPRYSFDVFGSGPLTNLANGDQQAWLNAGSHVLAATAIPLACYAIGGRKWMRICGVSWMGYSLLEESLYHCPGACPVSGGYNSELRTDLITRLVPTLAVLGLDLLLRKE